jgi:UDP-3-O-[3-hydroxymyristoyl] glucosamine N-acyltransferase
MSRTAKEVAVYLGATVVGDGTVAVRGVAGPEKAGPEDLVYLDAPKNRERVIRSAARCVVVKRGTAIADKTTIEVENPKLAFAKAAAFLADKSTAKPAIHPTAIVAKSARLAADVNLGRMW